MESKVSKFLASCMLSSLAISNIGVAKVSAMEQQFNYKNFMETAKTGMDGPIFDYFLITMGDVYAYFSREDDFDIWTKIPNFIEHLKYTMRGLHYQPKDSVTTLPFLPSMFVSKFAWNRMNPYIYTLCPNLKNLNQEDTNTFKNAVAIAISNCYLNTGYQRKEEVDPEFLTLKDWEIDIDTFRRLDITGYSGLNIPEDSKINYGDYNCPICLRLLGNSELCIIHQKYHIYHEKCLRKYWKENLEKLHVCPICRQNVEGSMLIRTKFVAREPS